MTRHWVFIFQSVRLAHTHSNVLLYMHFAVKRISVSRHNQISQLCASLHFAQPHTGMLTFALLHLHGNNCAPTFTHMWIGMRACANTFTALCGVLRMKRRFGKQSNALSAPSKCNLSNSRLCLGFATFCAFTSATIHGTVENILLWKYTYIRVWTSMIPYQLIFV